MTDAYSRLVAALRDHGCIVDDKGDHGAASTPGHSPQDRGTTFRKTEDGAVVYCHNGDTEQVLTDVGLSKADLFDSPRPRYQYPDGRIVERRYRDDGRKTFHQSGNKAGTALFGSDRLPDNRGVPVLVVEGEKDVIAAQSVDAFAVSQAQGASTPPDKADWSPLRGRPVLVVADKDGPGRERAEKVAGHLAGIAARVTVTQAKNGNDLADHIAAGHDVGDLVVVAEVRPPRRLVVTRGSEVKTKRVRWVDQDWMPEGSLVLLAGREGLGKSTIACEKCARVTRGELEGEWFGQPRNVLYLHTEDAREFTVAPRLRAAGADMDRVLFVDVQTEHSDTGTLILPADVSALEDLVVEHEVSLIVLDAATSAMSSELSGKDDRQVRQFLEPLAQLAARRGCVVLGLCHFGKRDGSDTGKLILGSIAWSQVARSVLSVAKDEESGNLIVTNTKGNLAPRVRSMEAVIESATIPTEDGTADVGVLRWLGESERDARELLAGEDAPDAEERTAAEAWLEDYLTQHGQTPAKIVKAEARKQGLSDATIKRAAKSIGVAYEIAGFPRTSVWRLQSAQSDQGAHTREPNEPTEPTGRDQHKRSEPTERKLQSAHAPVNEPTGEPTESAPPVRTPGRTVGQWIGSGEPVSNVTPLDAARRADQQHQTRVRKRTVRGVPTDRGAS
ncbi:AAA family ATPase [Nocardia gipuzkoensis]|uniref:AAA family ATPase n=1 Tax=Nocardia gipuzkoensis TaxID=2749991 RepID=UPI00237E862C|nr:AAA family ATPase [Nocardia gipuzkoensis]MDE1668833.1 AAA family ATPase [Nocardia gipuzkoensis]